jgi:hypothetical protein
VGLLAVASLQVGLVSLGLSGWPCPLWSATGLPCPGCGLSRAAAALAHGDWQTAALHHPFVVVVPIALALAAAGALGPGPFARRFGAALRAADARTHLTFILAVAFLVFGLMRFVVAALPFVEGLL